MAEHRHDEMWSSDSDPEFTAVNSSSSSFSSSSTTTAASPPPSPPPAPAPLSRHSHRHHRRRKKISSAATADVSSPLEDDPELEPKSEDVWRGAQWEAAWPGRCPKPVVLAEDEGAGGDAVGRSRSLTDDDLEELKGCADLGFGFSYDEIPELRSTLPALELCYSMSQRLLDDGHSQSQSQAQLAPEAAPSPPVTNWKISSPGDSPDEVKARLKYWAQAVACTVRLCS